MTASRVEWQNSRARAAPRGEEQHVTSATPNVLPCPEAYRNVAVNRNVTSRQAAEELIMVTPGLTMSGPAPYPAQALPMWSGVSTSQWPTSIRLHVGSSRRSSALKKWRYIRVVLRPRLIAGKRDHQWGVESAPPSDHVPSADRPPGLAEQGASWRSRAGQSICGDQQPGVSGYPTK